MKTWVVLNDLQIPWHDKPVVELVTGFTRGLKPDGVILNGDIVDCVSPETRVLTEDLRWVEAATLTVGTAVMGFDEYGLGLTADGRNRSRKLRRTTVTGAALIKQPVYRLTVASGETVTASAGHQWLGWPQAKNGATAVWLDTRTIAERVAVGKAVILHRAVKPWTDVPRTWEAGYLNAAFDGEGHVTFHRDANNFGHLGFSQKENPFMAEVEKLLAGYGFVTARARRSDGMTQLLIKGGMWEHARFIGMFRPQRFVEKWVDKAPVDGYEFWGTERARVIRVEDLGEQWVVSLRTGTRTFLAEGFSSHNCYAISDFSKDPNNVKRWGITREITDAGKLMHSLRDVPEKWWLGGNHEDRWRRVHWQHPNLKGMLKSFPEAFRMADYGFKWKPWGGVINLGKLLVTHGVVALKHSGQSAREHFMKYGSSVLHGHTHRGGVYYRTNAKGIHAGYENFCLCRTDPEWTKNPDWQQGFSVVHVDTGGWFYVQQIPILKRRTFFYGRERIGA